MLLAKLLKEKVRACTSKCVGWELGLDRWLEVAVFGIQVAQHIKNLAWLRDGEADITQAIGNVLELGAVVVDAQVALLDGAELNLQVHSALHLVVAEQALDGAPDGECRGIQLVHVVEDAFGTGGLEPVDDCVVVHLPLRIALAERRWGEDVRPEAEFAEDRVEEAASLGVVGFLEAEDRVEEAAPLGVDGNVVADVKLLDDRGGAGGTTM
jgi:hypothetical protein